MFTSTITKVMAVVVAALLSSTTVLASPTPMNARGMGLAATATIVSYFVAPSCDSPYSQAAQNIGSNTCMDLGEDGTTRSISFYNLAVQSDVVIPTCVARVWEDETCGGGYTEFNLTVGEPAADQTCIPGSSAMLGSVMLVCN